MAEERGGSGTRQIDRHQRRTGAALASLVAVPLAAATLVYAAAAGAQEAPAGEAIMNRSCASCHDIRVIQTAAKDQAEWTTTVDNMIERGADVSAADRDVLIPYLTRSHGPMPDGPGKAIVLNTCTLCHDLTRIKNTRHTADEWEETLIAMLNEGAPLSDDDFPTVLTYLARHFGVE